MGAATGVAEEVDTLAPPGPVSGEGLKFRPAGRGGGVHQEVALLPVVVDVYQRLAHQPVRVHTQDMTHPL